nr:CopG family transcriptional regulator [Candidatus Freyarchaeota archaeon]
MSVFTVRIPRELKERMEALRDVNWSEVARKAFEEKIKSEEMKRAAKMAEEIRKSSKVTEWSGVEEIRKWREERR